jgi:hypothetical protein
MDQELWKSRYGWSCQGESAPVFVFSFLFSSLDTLQAYCADCIMPTQLYDTSEAKRPLLPQNRRVEVLDIQLVFVLSFF